eukprot:6192062-Pleurochrysis_carterae.AAC.2
MPRRDGDTDDDVDKESVLTPPQRCARTLFRPSLSTAQSFSHRSSSRPLPASVTSPLLPKCPWSSVSNSCKVSWDGHYSYPATPVAPFGESCAIFNAIP